MVKEIERKTVHILIGTVLIVLGIQINNQYGVRAVTFILFILTCLSIFMDYILAHYRMNIPIYARLQRPIEKNSIHHHTYALFSSTLLSIITAPSLLLTAAAIITYGDAAAALVGKTIVSKKINSQKTFAGTLAMLITSLIASAFILGPTVPAFGAAIAGTLAELYSDHISDALTIPLAAGLTAHILSMIV